MADHAPPERELKNPTIEAPPDTILAVDRKNARKEKFKNEKLQFQLKDSRGQVPDGCTWKITRMKLTSKMMQELISRSPMPGKLDFVQEETSGDVLFPEDMQLRCMPLPHNYIINLRRIRFAEDVYDDPHFAGYMQVVLRDVPRHCRNGEEETSPEAVKLWIAYGLKEEHPTIRRLAADLGRTKLDIEKLEKVMKRIPKVRPHDAKGNEVTGDDADSEREAMRQRALEEKEVLEAQLIDQQAALDRVVELLKNMDITVERVDDGSSLSRFFNSWYVHFGDIDEEVSMSTEDEVEFDVEATLLKKSDWNGINLAVGYMGRDSEGKKKWIAPWAGRGTIPDGHKEFIPDYTGYDVNMRGVQVLRVGHGIGMYKSLDKRGVDFFGPKFSVYHGMWKEGKRHGYGQQYDDVGIYSGFWENDRRRGRGHMDFPHGLAYQGEFGAGKHHKAEGFEFDVLPGNPYADGLPNDQTGNAEFTYPDGSAYRGQVKDGKITGRGKYINAMGETMEGEFRNGVLHGHGTKVDVLGRKWVGDWADGQLRGDGVFTSPDRDMYRGSWLRHERHGWGFERYRNGNNSHGFYTYDERHGHSCMHHGHVREKYDKTTSKTVMSSRMTFEGFFLAGSSAGRGLNTYRKSLNRYYTSSSKNTDKKKFLENLKTIRTANEAKWRDLKGKYEKLDLTLRRDMTRRKTRIFVQQRRSAKEALMGDARREYSQREVNGSLRLRANRVAGEIESKRVSEEEAEKMVESNPVSDGAAELLRLATESDQLNYDGSLFKPAIVDVIQSDFEEAEERRRFMPYEKIKERAQRKIAAQERVEALLQKQS